jgi:hypothetical protein
LAQGICPVNQDLSRFSGQRPLYVENLLYSNTIYLISEDVVSPEKLIRSTIKES